MGYKKYQHVERLGNKEVEGICIGECHIFPKLDGTNAHIWMENGEVKCGSRSRELSLDSDNAGFMAHVMQNEELLRLVIEFNHLHIYGEWLVTHSLKTYREEAWRKFYIFDMVTSEGQHLPYDQLKAICEMYNVCWLEPLKIITNPTYENLIEQMERNTVLIQEGKGPGEGIVIKNYGFVNKYGRQTWAKLVTNEFKEKHVKEMGAPRAKNNLVEIEAVEKFLTKAMVEKVHAKIKLDNDGWSSRDIPQLFGRVWHDFVTECIWEIVNKMKRPTINFKTLYSCVVIEIKKLMPELF